MQQNDAQDVFSELCSDFEEYPRSELQKKLQKHKPQDAFYAQQQWEKLQERQEALFKADVAEVTSWETGRRNKFPTSQTEQAVVFDVDDLKKHLNRGEKDPHVRHLFISAIDSRSLLRCSMDLFKLACCYHQVDPSFLESVHTFGKQSAPVDFCLAHFKASDNLRCPTEERLQLPRLGRSGREIKLSYLLRSVEYSTSGPTGVWGWQIRQVANYHSFDLGTGRAFWLTIKGNGLLEDRIQRFSSFLDIPSKSEVSEHDVSPYLKASLATHIVYLSWCDENWRQFINEVEEAIRHVVAPAIGALVDDHIDPKSDRVSTWPKTLHELRRSTMSSKHQTRSDTVGTDAKESQSTMLSRAINLVSRSLSWSTRSRKEKNPDSDPEKANQVSESAPSRTASVMDPHGTLDKFRFTDLQSLHLHSEAIQKATLVLELNIGVIRDLLDYYGHLAATEFKAKTGEKTSCEEVIEGFLQEVVSITRGLETRMKQLECLQANLSQSMALYERVLQQKSNLISTTFADYSLENNIQMQRLTDNTAKQTTSMHVITVATILFLPATFVATFFQSGVLLWSREEDPEDIKDTFELQAAKFRLFVEIFVPLTVVTVGGWLIVFWKTRTTAKGNIKNS